MILTEKQILDMKTEQIEFLRKIRLYEKGLNYKKEEARYLIDIIGVAEFDLDLDSKKIREKEIEKLSTNEFFNELDKYFDSISQEIIDEFQEVNYALDNVLQIYKKRVKKIIM